MNGSVRNRIIRGDLLIGAIITLPSTELAEIFCMSGFDWLFVDIEHSALTIRDAQLILQAVTPKFPCLIRVPSNDEVWIKKSLDIGASGIIIPQIRSAGDARQAVRLCKYPPEGSRGVGVARAQGYGGNFQKYVASANDETVVIIQIEHKDAVDDIENIVRVSGIDCLFVGPYDLSASMGKMGLTTDPAVQKAISHVKKYADQAKIPLGIFGATAEVLKPYIQSGYTLIAVCIDTMLIEKAAKNIVASLK
ncbi:HpcH/HpaI aldolase family protein [Desulfonema magnum]|uniref:Aldolase domain-containing protein n=1 Tax=Desulfonema magnum TaxID=45655 RepID=A0A975BHD9_9BACT|nr:aldolase/citrate lyase family protein [Desulfonema magnum]QTA85486.1 Aldolase domain-containing protein [Desulfonema magnum]